MKHKIGHEIKIDIKIKWQKYSKILANLRPNLNAGHF